MCDYSLMNAKSRPATVGEKLVTKNFGMGTRGFASVNDDNVVLSAVTAVCVLPGTELAFDAPVNVAPIYTMFNSQEARTIEATTARFRQINKETTLAHHDALEFGDGDFVLLTNIIDGQVATVLQLPAMPKTAEEAQEQKRLEVVA